MKTELIIAGKSSGQMWEVSKSVEEITWETNRTGSPGVLKFTLLKSGNISFFEGVGNLNNMVRSYILLQQILLKLFKKQI